MLVTKCELKDIPNYYFNINILDGFTIQVNVEYNVRSGLRLISASLLDGTVLLYPTLITHGRIISFNRNVRDFGYEVVCALEQKGDYTGDDYLNWSKQFTLNFGIFDLE